MVDRNQGETEKARVYAPVRRNSGIGCKELHAGIARVMQDYCGEYKQESTLKIGLSWPSELSETEASTAMARNPHELMRTLNCLTRLTVGEMTLHASLARRASSFFLNYKRLDYPQVDPEEWNKFVTIKLQDGEVKAGELPFNYWLMPPYASSYRVNMPKM
jgi:succinate dehydrogenase/fumarate reductase flavoprotein subunit